VPLFYQQDINEQTRMGIWHISEAEDFFLSAVPIQSGITHPHKRLQHLAGRYLLPYLFPDFPYEEILIADTRKPYLPDERYHFSISHCGDYAAAIVSSKERVGIDIEMITHRVERIKQKFLHPDELDFVHTHSADQQVNLLTLLWSAKEAMFKWGGRGDIDFSDVLRLGAFSFSAVGNIPALFSKEAIKTDLTVHYKMYDTLSLAWINSP
jgi:phosphopantetheine--protein transferase-like protein